MLWWVPLESLEERYTAQWAKWFPEEFRRQGIQFRTIEGESLCDTVEVGTFLDINSTVAYKASQIQTISGLFHRREIRDNDVFFLADTEMFGMEGTIRYLADLNQIKVRIVGFAHAGSYTREDFVEKCASYARHYERAWSDVFDLILVGSLYHRHQLDSLRGLNVSKIKVTGNPYDVDAVRVSIPWQTKRNRVICTNRPDPEKRPLETLEVFRQLKQKHPDWEFMVTTSRKTWGSGEIRRKALELEADQVITICEGISKQTYLTLLSQSQVMTGNSIEENFGYCILEALVMDTIPVIEDKYSHRELVSNDHRCLFSRTRHPNQIDQIEKAMANPFSVSWMANQYQDSLSTIVGLLHSLSVDS